MKKIPTTTISALLLAVLAGPGAAPAAPPICGDVNDNGSVTVADALTVLKEAVGQAPKMECGPRSLLPKTGQATCHDVVGATIACANSGQDGELQRGTARRFTDNGDGTITDDTTSLVWEKLSADSGVHDYTTSYAWAESFSLKVATLNATNFAGHDDWRLPNIVELESLRDFGATDPAVPPAFHSGCSPGCAAASCSCTQAGFYWSSSTLLSAPTSAWHVSFLKGTTYPGAKTDPGYVRAVRGGRD